jgi:hypothetical protein
VTTSCREIVRQTGEPSFLGVEIAEEQAGAALDSISMRFEELSRLIARAV